MLPPNPQYNLPPGANMPGYGYQMNGNQNNYPNQAPQAQDVNQLAAKMVPMSLANNLPPTPQNAYHQPAYNGAPQPQAAHPAYSQAPPASQFQNNHQYNYQQSTSGQVPQLGGLPQMPPQVPGSTPTSYSNPMTPSYAAQSQQQFMPPQMPGLPPTNLPPSSYPSNMPGQVPPGAYGQMPPQPGAMPGMMPQRKVDPEALPSAIDVIENDRSKNGGSTFQTGPRGVLPPLVTTEFSCRDEGNCNPRFIRSSLYAVPNSPDLLKSCGIPFSLTCCPFAQLHPNDQPVMLSDMGNLGPVRCIRCKAYMSPMMSFIDGGRRFNCPLCGGTTSCPDDYFAHVDHTGRRTDAYSRPELCLGSYELTATKEYCRNSKLPKSPAFIFLIDVSQTALRSGAVSLFCSRFVSDILPNLPKDDQALLQYQYSLRNYEDQLARGEEPQGPQPKAPESEIAVGFITYDRHLHFYSFLSVAAQENGHLSNGHLTNGHKAKAYAQPRMNIIADTEEMFVPGVEGFLIPGNNVKAIESLLELIPQHFMGDGAPMPQAEPVLAPAVQAGLEALKAAERPGKLFIVHSTLPTLEAPGRLKNRDDRKLIGTEKEKQLLNPVNDFYTTLGQQCVQNGCSVDLFLMPTSYADVATVSEVCKYTGGHLFKYSCFLAETHGEEFISDLVSSVSSPRAFDCVMKVRTSAGTRPVDFFCHGYTPNTTDVEVASIDKNWALTVEIKHDDKLPDGDVVFIQAAILYTSLNGQRRLRIHNLALNSSNQATDIFSLSDLDTSINFLAKNAARSVLVKSSQQVMEDITTRVATILAAYRKYCYNQNSGGHTNPAELVLPETQKLLPLLAQCLIKSDIIRPANEIAIDDRSMILFLIHGMNLSQSASYFYPRLLPLHNLNLETDDIPVGIRCSFERLQPSGAYLLDNGVNMFMWVGSSVSQEWIQSVFNVSTCQQLAEGAVLHERDNVISKRVNGLVNQIRLQHSRRCRLVVIKQGDRAEIWLKHFMLEDRAENCPAYLDYVCHVHREVRNLLK